MDFRVRVPLWTILVGQCVLVAAVFTTLIAVFSTQMYSMTKSQVEERLTARLSTVREAVLKPFLITQNAAETLAATAKMDPHTYRVSGNSTAMTKDGKFLRIAGSLLSSSGGFVEYISQISDDGVVERKGLFTMGVAQPISINPLDNFSYISGAIARDSLSIKIARNSVYATAAANTIPETLWLANYNNVSSGRYGGPYTFTRDSVVEPQLSNNMTIRSWTTFGIENNEQFADEFPYSLLSAFTIVLEQDGNMSSAPEHYLHRFPNTWLVSACANLRSIQPILRDLIVTEDGLSALYDVSSVQSYSISGHQQNEIIILLSTSRADLEVLEPSSKTFYNAFNTPYPRLNMWFVACFEDSSQRFVSSFGPSGSTNNSLVVAQRSVSHSFTYRDRFLSYVHIYLPVGGVVPSAATSTADDDKSANLHLFAVVSTPKAHYFGDQNRVQNIMIAVGVVCAIIITSFCVALVVAIAMPLREIRSNMALAAHLKNDRVVATSSSLVEIDKVCDAFVKMNKLLLEARAFIPASMLVRTSDEDNDDENPDNQDLDDDDSRIENENGDFPVRNRNAARKKKHHRFVDEDDVEEDDEGNYGGTTVGGDSADELYDDDDEGDFSLSRSRSRRHSSANECTSTNTDTNPATRKPSQYGFYNNGKNGSFPTIHKVSKSATGTSSPSPATSGATARNGKEIAATSSVKISSSNPNASTASVSTTSSLTRKRTSGFFGSSTRSKSKGGQLGMSLSGSSSTTILKNRRVAVLCINVRGFTTLSAFSIDSLPAHATLLLDTVSQAATAERGVIDSFHGDHFVLSFNAVKAAASPAKKATLCAMAVANALEGTPFACLSMGASSGTAIVGALGNSSQRRLSIVGPCYVKALRLQRASAQLERSVDPLFFVPPTNVGTLLPAIPPNNNSSIHTPLGNRSSANLNAPSRFYSRGATGGNNNNTHNNNHHGDELNTTRHSSYPNCFYLLIDKTSYTESRDVAETLLVGSLATPIRTRTLAGVMKKMTSLFTTRGSVAATGAGVKSAVPASSSSSAKPSVPSVFPSIPSMPSCDSESPLTGIKTRFPAFTSQGIMTVQSMSLTPQQQAQFRQQLANDNNGETPAVNASDASLADDSRSVNLSISGFMGHNVPSSATALHHVQVRPANKPTTTAAVEDPTEVNLLVAENITLAQQTVDEDKGSPLIFARNGALFENVTAENNDVSSPNGKMLPNFPAHIDSVEPQDKREKVTRIVSAVTNGATNDDADSEDGSNFQLAETPIGMVRNGNDSSQYTPAAIRRSSTVTSNTVTVVADVPAAFARSRSQSSTANRESNVEADLDLLKPVSTVNFSGKKQNARKQSIPAPVSFSVVGENGTKQTNVASPITGETNKPSQQQQQPAGERHVNISSPTKLIAGPAITVYAVLKLRTYNQRRQAAQQVNHLYNHPQLRGGGSEKIAGDAGIGGDSTTVSSITTTDAAVSELDHDEWMYEVQKKNDNDVFRFVNTATESLQKGDLESALNAAIERSERAAAKWESDKQDLRKRLDAQQATSGGIAQQQSLLLTVPPRDVVVLNLAVLTLKTAFSGSASQTVSPSAVLDSSVFDADMSTNSSSLHRTAVDGVLENLSIHHQRHLHAQSPIIRPEELLVFFEGISLASTFHITQLLAKQNSATSTPLSPVEFKTQASSKAFSASSPNHTDLSPQTAASLTHNFGGLKSRKGFESAAENDGDSGDEDLVRQQSNSGWNNVINKISVIANRNNAHKSNTHAGGANSIPQMSFPPLTNIEAAELAMWLRVCKIVSVVGCGGKQFVAATSFQ